MSEQGGGEDEGRGSGPGATEREPCFPDREAMRDMAEVWGCAPMMREMPSSCCGAPRSRQAASEGQPNAAPEGRAR